MAPSLDTVPGILIVNTFSCSSSLLFFPLYLPLMSRVLCNCLDLFNSLTYPISTHTHTHTETNSELFFFLSCPLWRASRVCQASHSPQRSFLSKAATLSRSLSLPHTLYPWAFSSLTDANCKGPLSRGIHTG